MEKNDVANDCRGMRCGDAADGGSHARADEKRYEYLLARLNAKISVEVQEAPLKLLLTTLEDLASLPDLKEIRPSMFRFCSM